MDPEKLRKASGQELLDLMLREDVDDFTFSIEKHDTDPGVTFSKEGMTTIHDQVWTWIGARLMARFNKLKRGPKKMSVEVRVRFDDE